MTTSSIPLRVGVSDSAITNFNPYSVEMDTSIYCIPSLQLSNGGLIAGGWGAFRHDVVYDNITPFPTNGTSRVLKEALLGLERDSSFAPVSSSTQLIAVRNGAVEIIPRGIPSFHLVNTLPMDEKTWLRFTTIMSHWKTRETLEPIGGISSKSLLTTSGNSQAKLVNIFQTQDKQHAVYSFVVINTRWIYAYQAVPVLVHVWVDQFSPALQKSPDLRLGQLDENWYSKSLSALLHPPQIDGWSIPIFNRMYGHTGLFCNSFGEPFFACSTRGEKKLLPLSQVDSTMLSIARIRAGTVHYPGAMGNTLYGKIEHSSLFSGYSDMTGFGYTLNAAGVWEDPRPTISFETDPVGAVGRALFSHWNVSTINSMCEKGSSKFRKTTPTAVFSKDLITSVKNLDENRSDSYLAKILKEETQVKLSRLRLAKDEKMSFNLGKFKFEGPDSPKGKALADVATAILKIRNVKAGDILEAIPVTAVTTTATPELQVIEPLIKIPKLEDLSATAKFLLNPDLRTYAAGDVRFPVPL